MYPVPDFSFPPALIFIVGALFIPFFSDRLRPVYMLALPVIAFITLYSVPNGVYWEYTTAFGYKLVLGRIDGLSRIFGTIFIIATFIGVIFSLKVRDKVQHVSALVYAGSAIGVTFSADFFSLYVFWEFMAIASTFLILARKTDASQQAAFRYVMVHIFGGLSLLAGIILQIRATGSTTFSFIGLESTASWFIFVGVAVNAAVMPLHGWLKDAYPEATATGAVFLSAFTTKSAVYVMARMFPGTPLLIWLGVAMTALPIFYAVLENDIRRVLAYSLINQVGFMLCGIGIGSELAINGAAAHAFCHILYKALLFMSAGAVMERTGKTRCTDLGGLYRTMPLTCLFCIIGAASISAFPLFSGFVSKSMIISAADHENLIWVWLVFQFASAGVFHHAGIKVPFFMFFGHDSGLRPKEAPINMLIAMGMAAFLCVYLAINFDLLYSLLPYATHYEPYTGAHVIGQLQLLMFGALAFCLLILSGIYPAEIRAEHLDTDWFYRKGAVWFYQIADRVLNRINVLCDTVFARGLPSLLARFAKDAPATLTLSLLVPVVSLFNTSENERAKLIRNVNAAFATGTVPVGIGAAASGLFILFLFWMS
ncbi:MAG: Na(+)/H(+) antiporter subunit D [Deltaproteobacteria bacterium]|nr:MAG: Na(+)/H(+) antiporter subunit D [Deltaproteobacteria bacterium]